MHRIAAAAASALLSLAPAAHAASGIVLPSLDDASDTVDMTVEDQVRQDASEAFYTSPELFPEVETGGDGSTIDDLRDERTEGFLTIRVGTANVTLRDVPLSTWFAPYVRSIAELKLVSGYRDAAGMPTGEFGPADPVTLEQMAKVAVLAAGIDPAACAVPPRNLTASGAWSASFVACAEARAWAAYSDPATDLRRPATRQEVVMTVLQAFEREFDVDTASLTFTDVEKTGAFAPAIAKAAADGVVSGYTDDEGNLTGLFGPTNDVTRAEFSKIVSVALQLYAK